MHRLQQHILQQLIHHPSRRYAQIKPKPVEGNLFMYHLRQLMQAGLVIKQADGTYSLSGEGQVYADRLSLKTFTPRVQPRIVTLLALLSPAGEWLMYRRLRQPLINRIGFPYGKVHVGETIQQAANRELAEKTGLKAKLDHRGDGYITITEEGQIVSQILFHLFFANQTSGQLIKKLKVGQNFWANPAELPADELLPSVSDLIKLLESHPKERFFAELAYNL